MQNLSEFTRIIALMTDQLALLVTRDVRGVQEAALNAAAKAALPPTHKNSALPSNSGGPQAGGSSGDPPGGLLGEINRLLDQSSSSKFGLRKSNSSQSINEGSQSSLSSAQEGGGGVRHISSSGIQESNPKSGSEADGLGMQPQQLQQQQQQQQQQQHPDQQIQPQGQQQPHQQLPLQQQQREAYERFRESLAGRVGVALAK
ncbi:hypothetical protein DUNSADRAFT_6259, partial [Dunaliella salina]